MDRLSVMSALYLEQSQTEYASDVSMYSSTSSFLAKFFESVSDHILKQNGLTLLQKINDTQQGELYEALLQNDDEKSSQKVIVKRVSKSLHFANAKKHHPDDGGMRYHILKDVVKEALVFTHLTVGNQYNYIIKYSHFFTCNDYFYLVTEHLDHSMNLDEFVNKSHEYLRRGQLSTSEYLKVIKYIFWQLAVCIYSMHNDLNCCHLDLKLEHILLKDVHFIFDPKNNLITIQRNIGIKLCDFGSAEIFRTDTFECDKEHSVFDEIQYKSPLVAEGQTYDARKADIWALGIMLVHCLIGAPLYSSLLDRGYSAVKLGELEKYLNVQKMWRSYAKKKYVLRLLQSMLRMNEDYRCLSGDILKHKWFKSYYNKYGDSIEEKSKLYEKKYITEKQIIGSEHFPYL